jgi:hypothetical protein
MDGMAKVKGEKIWRQGGKYIGAYILPTPS